jgi:hypothetical protein
LTHFRQQDTLWYSGKPRKNAEIGTTKRQLLTGRSVMLGIAYRSKLSEAVADLIHLKIGTNADGSVC